VGRRLPVVAYDEQLAERVRERLQETDGVVELKMFGGWGVTVCGNMAVGVMDRDLIVRVGADAFTRSGVRPFDFTGRAMTGWVYVAGDSVTNVESQHMGRAWREVRAESPAEVVEQAIKAEPTSKARTESPLRSCRLGYRSPIVPGDRSIPYALRTPEPRVTCCQGRR